MSHPDGHGHVWRQACCITTLCCTQTTSGRRLCLRLGIASIWIDASIEGGVINAMVNAAAAAGCCHSECHREFSFEEGGCQAFWRSLLTRLCSDADPSGTSSACSCVRWCIAAQQEQPLCRLPCCRVCDLEVDLVAGGTQRTRDCNVSNRHAIAAAASLLLQHEFARPRPKADVP